MKNIKNHIKLIVAAAVFGAGVTSCSLDQLPLNEVVLENFWTNKADVESVVASCYVGMQENDYIYKLIVWGEDRSDNIDFGSNTGAALNSLLNGSLKTTNTLCNWSAMYNVINRCNTVLYYAPQVAGEDPNYTQSDLNINIAECKFIRALTYLTLIKTFKNVPFTLEPTIDDDIELRLGQTSFEDILDALISDIESCKDFAPRKYSNKEYNTGKVTRAAMYSLLAELYLWRASDANLSPDRQKEYYTRCIQACDWVINFKRNQKIKKDTNGEDIEEMVDENVWDMFGYPLLGERPKGSATTSMTPQAFTDIFLDCASFETIFEIAFQGGGAQKNNGNVATQYGTLSGLTGRIQEVLASQKIMAQVPNKSTYSDDALFTVNTDLRSVLAFTWVDGNSFTINKYVADKNYFTSSYNGTGTISESTYKQQNQRRVREDHYESWIIYRLAEIMLFRAEAEIELAGLIDPAAIPTLSVLGYRNGSDLVGSASELYNDSYNLITAVYIRSNPNAVSSKNLNTYAPKFSSFTDLAGYQTYLMNERRRELLFEGKRYYDLVRRARRIGNTKEFSSIMTSKLGSGSAALQVKLKMMDYLYMPIWKEEIKVNPNLVQNAAYADEEENIKN